MRSHQLSSPKASSERNSPVESTWPCTMCPSRRPAGDKGRSRLTREPARRSPRLLRRRVSGARSAEKESGRRSRAVRHTPLTAILAPSVMSDITVAQRTFKRAPAARAWMPSTVPSSSIIPVNIDVSFHGKLVRRNRVDGDLVYANGVGAAAPPNPAGQGQRFQAAENLGAVVEKDAVHAARFERGPVDLAAGFDHQREVLLTGQPIDHAAKIGAPARAVEHQHLDPAGGGDSAPLG